MDKKNKQVLIIDDDQWMQRILTRHLQQWGLAVINALDSYTGLSSAIKFKPDLIMLDLILPEVNGDHLLKFIKSIDITKNIPVIMVSGNLNREVLGKAFRDGATAFLSKPFNEKTLLDKLNEAVEGLIDMDKYFQNKANLIKEQGK